MPTTESALVSAVPPFNASSVPFLRKITPRSERICNARAAPPSNRGSTSMVTPLVSETWSVLASASICSAANATMLSGATIGRAEDPGIASPAITGMGAAAGICAINCTAPGCAAASNFAATLRSSGAVSPTTIGACLGGGGGRSTSGRMCRAGGFAASSERYAARRCCARARSWFGLGAVGSKSTADSETSP